jgi:signal transduction histidine kinase
MVTNVTYILNPYMVSNVNFYVPITLMLALSPLILWLIIILLIRNPKLRFFFNMITLIYTVFLMTIFLPSFLGYSLTQIYQLINTIGDLNMVMYLYNIENELTAIYTLASTFGLFYYAIGILLLIADTSLLWA